MNVSLPEKLKEDVDGRVETGGYGTASEYVRDLIRQDLDGCNRVDLRCSYKV